MAIVIMMMMMMTINTSVWANNKAKDDGVDDYDDNEGNENVYESKIVGSKFGKKPES